LSSEWGYVVERWPNIPVKDGYRLSVWKQNRYNAKKKNILSSLSSVTKCAMRPAIAKRPSNDCHVCYLTFVLLIVFSILLTKRMKASQGLKKSSATQRLTQKKNDTHTNKSNSTNRKRVKR